MISTNLVRDATDATLYLPRRPWSIDIDLTQEQFNKLRNRKQRIQRKG
jgi:hypothetical protein